MTTFRTISKAFAMALIASVAACAGTATGQIPSNPQTSTTYRQTSGAPTVRRDVAGSAWWMYYYKRSGNALKRTEAIYSNGVASFGFNAGRFTALLITQNPSLTGNLTGDTLTDTVSVSGATSQFVTQNGGSCTNAPYVRFYFSQSGGFSYTKYWWSDEVYYTLANGTATLSAPLTDPSQWSDWDGQSGSSNPSAFYAAVSHVKWVGLSFGGGCFFENGATVYSGSALFGSQFSESASF